MIARWFAYLLADITMTLLGLVSAPAVVPFARDGWLPRWLWWFQTPDNSLDGDHGWQTEHWQWRFKFLAPMARYIGRVGWLWRNNAYGFSTDVLGVKINTSRFTMLGDANVSNRPLHEGLVRRFFTALNGDRYFQWYYVRAWSSRYCLRINLGWKLWGVLTVGESRQFVFSINPFMSYST